MSGRGNYIGNQPNPGGAVSGVPAGAIMDFGGTAAPSGWALCDGTAVSRSTFAVLFTAIGTTWGVGDGSTTFNLPNFARRIAVGSGGAGTGTLAATVGSTGGGETVVLVQGNIPSHQHTFNIGNAAGGFNGFLGGTASGAGTSDAGRGFGQSDPNSGAGSAGVNIMQPSAVVLKIIKT